MKINLRVIIFGIVIIICIIAVNFAIYWQFFRNESMGENNVGSSESTISNQQLAKEFNTIFNNTLDKQGNTTTQINRIDEGKDIVFTQLSKTEKIDNKYELEVNIPYVNIDNNLVKSFNEKIDNIFTKKANEIISSANNNTIYDVEYVSYINSNILSLVIKSTLKEGNNPQRVIIQTYNYNLSTNEELTLSQILEIKKMSKASVETQIKEVIKEANKQAMSLKELGYNVYSRELESSIYKVDNTTTYFIGANGKLYILYPYGNSNYTSETDIIVF